jgi:hypothetical protein
MSKRRVLVRTYSAGVFFGELTKRSKNGKRGVVKNARRIWYWEGAASLSQLAEDGTSAPDKCKFPKTVKKIELTEIIEVLRVTDKAAASIDKVSIWEK